MTAQIYVFQVNGTQVTPSDPIVSTPWTTKEAAEAAAATYAAQLKVWWHGLHPKDFSEYVEVMPDLLHLDPYDQPIRYGIQPDEFDGHPAPVGLSGYYAIDWDGMEWNPFPF